MSEKQFRPMLAERKATWDDFAKIFSPNSETLLASPKLDGIRCIIRDQRAVSRTLKPIPNQFIQQTLSNYPELNGLDGELIVGSRSGLDVFKRSSSGIMSHAGNPNFTFWVFDSIDYPPITPFKERLSLLREEIFDGQYTVPGHTQVRLLDQIPVISLAQLESLEEDFVKKGYEGVILRHPMSPYKWGRSTLRERYMLKLKRHQDSEAKITGFEPLYHNMNEPEIDNTGHTKRSSKLAQMVMSDQLGAFKVQDIHKPEWEFSVGTGFTALDRVDFWNQRKSLLGKIIKYRWLPVGTDQKPRHPVYHGLRDPLDIST